MDFGPTKRIAIEDLDFIDKIPLKWIHRIFSNIVGNENFHLDLHMSSQKKLYTVATFEKIHDAEKIYAYCDGVSIEDTFEVFNLSFVPDDMELPASIEREDNSRGFDIKAFKSKKLDLEESSDEPRIFSENPQEEKHKSTEDTREKTKIIEKDTIPIEIKKINEEKEIQSNFVLDINDERFEVLYTDENFRIDVSNPEFEKSKENMLILKETYRRINRK